MQCGQRLPAGKEVKLILTRPGSKEIQSLQFSVREAFSASLTCQREDAQSPCIPLQPVSLHFTEGVPRKLAEQIRLKAPDGERKPDLGRNHQRHGQ